MQTRLSSALLATEQGREADAILRRCVHCGFCNATCPTYQLQGDELDGPRGRIYLIKQLLEGKVEGEADSETARTHLDRCLTCRNCETTCPSGVEYNRLLEMGREHVEQRGRRPLYERLLRWGLLHTVPFPTRFAFVMGIARRLGFLLPKTLRKAIPPSVGSVDQWPAPRHSRRVLLLEGCVQSVSAPAINLAAARLLDGLGISAIRVNDAGCCGALNQHLAAPDSAAAFMRRNIDAWRPLLGEGAQNGVEAIVSTASACGLQVKDYGHYLRLDDQYAQKAAQVSASAKDVAELLAAEPVEKIVPTSAVQGMRVAFHAPCTLQHGQRVVGVVETILQRCGFELLPVAEGHLCCGAAGTYSILQPDLSARLQANKLEALQAGGPALIASANIGCLLHLQDGAGVPVKHWVELLADCVHDQ